jgi:hypothetical protein
MAMSLNDYAKTQGFTGNVAGQGNSAFQLAAAQSLANNYAANPTAQTTVTATSQAKNDVNKYYNTSYYKDVVAPNEQKTPLTGGTGYVAPDNTGMINNMAQASEQARMAQLESSKKANLANLDTERTKIQPMYYDKRNQTAALAQQQARNFAEFMAQRGGVSSGANMQATLSNMGAMQGNIGALQRQEAQDISDIERRRQLIEGGFIDQANQIKADSESAKMKMLYEDAQNKQSNMLQVAQLTGMLGNTPTMAKQQMDYNISQDSLDRYNNQLSQLGKVTDPTTGQVVNTFNASNTIEDRKITEANRLKKEYIDTIGKFSTNYQAEIDKVLGDGDTTNDWQADYLTLARQQKVADNLVKEKDTIGIYSNNYQAEINRRQASASKTDDALIPHLQLARLNKLAEQKDAQAKKAAADYKNAFDTWEKLGTASGWVATALGVPEGTKTLAKIKAEADISNETARTGIMQQNANANSLRASNSGSGGTSSDYSQTDFNADLKWYKDVLQGDYDKSSGKYVSEYGKSDVYTMLRKNAKIPEGAQNLLMQYLGIDYDTLDATGGITNLGGLDVYDLAKSYLGN